MKNNWTILDILNWTSNYFKEKNIKEYKHKAELLLSSLLNCSRVGVYLKFSETLDEDKRELLKQWIKRIVNNEPIQYILGNWDFYGINFKVDSRALIPRFETEELVEKCLNELIKNKNIFEKKVTIVDVGTGTGAIIISLYLNLKKSLNDNLFKNIKFIATDINPESLVLATENAAKHNCDNISFINTDILENIDEKTDILISNPPYISLNDYNNLDNELFYEPKIALTDNSNGLTILHKIIEQVSKRQIKYSFFEFGYDQKESLTKYLEKFNFSFYEFYKDLSENDRMLFIKF